MIIGSQILGNKSSYKVIREIGKGGMAIAYLAQDNRNQNVIIKSQLIKGDGVDDLRKDKLEVEAKVLRDLLNPGNKNIVKYLDESRTNNIFHLIIEKLSDETLKDKIKNHRIDEQTVIVYLQSLLNALKYLHARNIIHRDIKPQNILFDIYGETVLIDFGGAKEGCNVMPGNETQLFTPGWSCRHQTTGGLTTSCDLYALGCVLFYMLTGEEPKLHMNQNGLLTKKPNQINPQISQRISELPNLMVDPDHKIISTVSDVENYLKQGNISSYGKPHIIMNGIKYEIHDELDIGRQHLSCNNVCFQIGYNAPPKVSITESGDQYLSRHHARIWKDKNGYCWIQDLKSRNGTAIYRSGMYRLLFPGQKEMLMDKSLIALVYTPQKGPYMTITFHER